MTTESFFASDYSGTLFPLKTNLLMATHHAPAISEYIYQHILNPAQPADSFLPQQRVYATKRGGHLRRTFKLDPIAEFFIYDLCYRNRGIFRKAVTNHRLSFGYRFENGSHVPINDSYKHYKKELRSVAPKYKHHIKFDIASYFNCIYHHDLSHWFSNRVGQQSKDAAAFGQFLREINSGRSVDVLPQGIYPCKMIGNEFLKFVDQYSFLKSSHLIRFMDDFALFDDSQQVLQRDFFIIQQLLGQYALNVNPSKTRWDVGFSEVTDALEKLKESLSDIVEDFEPFVDASGAESMILIERKIETTLNEFQVASVIDILKGDDIEESDADQILTFLLRHSNEVIEVVPELLRRFPNLIKHVHSVCRGIGDKERLCEILSEFLRGSADYLEYQLFWIAAIADDFLIDTEGCGALVSRLFELTADYRIARAKVLEIPTQKYGLKERRDEYLKTGQSDWLSWASAMGSRSLDVAERNYALKYFAKGSPMNHLVSTCVEGL